MLKTIALAALFATQFCSQASAAVAAAAAQPLHTLVEAYWDDYLRLNPSVASATGDYRYNDRLENRASENYLANTLALERDYLARSNALPAPQPGTQDRLTYDLFRRDREQRIAGLRFPDELLCIDQYQSFALAFVRMAAGGAEQPFRNVKDYDDFLQRIDAYAGWNRTAITNLRHGLARGITLPRVLVEQVAPQLAAVIARDPDQSPFFRPVEKFPATIAPADRERLRAAYRDAIVAKLNPAYQALHDFLLSDYLTGARTTIAWTTLPMGQQWYAYKVGYWTTTGATPEQIHAQGLREVARLTAAIDALMPQLAFVGDRRGFFDYLRKEPRFAIASDAELQSAGLALQKSAAARLATLPRFRRHADYPAYTTGLGLYAYGASTADVASEAIPDPYRSASLLGTELRSAARLVVDTGIHTKGWTRAQALKYWLDSVPLSSAAATAEVDRSIAQPGESLASELGALKFRELQARAQQRLGERFDLHEFQLALLQDGALPLEILDARVQRWLAMAAAVSPAPEAQ